MSKYTDNIKFFLKSEFGKHLENASEQEIYYALSKAIMTDLADNWEKTKETYAKEKQEIGRAHV